MPQSLPGRDHIISVLTRLGDETRNAWVCRDVMEFALQSYQSPKDWEKVLSYNACVMMGLSKIPDEFFEEHEKLEGEERYALNKMLLTSNLPTL